MAHDDEEDLYDEEFDFVDDEEVSEEDDVEEASDEDDADFVDEPIEERAVDRSRERDYERRGERDTERAPSDAEGDVREDRDEAEVPEDEYGRTEPLANYVVHVYEDQKFKRTIERPFTPEDAEAFATEFNRTAKNYSRVAVTAKNDAKPKKALD